MERGVRAMQGRGKGSLVLIGLVVLMIGGVGAGQERPVRIGLLLSYTGGSPFQAIGTEQGVQLAVEEAGGQVAGRRVELLREDTEVNPTVALAKARRLVEERRVEVLIGPVWSHEALALLDYLKARDVIWVIPVAATRLLMTPERAGPRMFRVVETTDQSSFPHGRWVVRSRGHRNVVVFATDVAFGHDSAGAFEAGVRAAGGQVLRKVFVRLGTLDFAPFLTATNMSGAEAVYACFAGIDAIRFVQQYAELGWKARLPLHGCNPLVDDPYLPEIGEAAVGVFSLAHYTSVLDTPENQRFVEAYQRKFRQVPYRYSEYGYAAGKLILAGLRATRGEAGRPEDLASAMKRSAQNVVTPVGPLRFDRWNQRVFDLYVLRVERREGRLVNVPVDRMGRISQVDVWQWWRK